MENPPKLDKSNKIMLLMEEIQNNGKLKKFQDDYLYWDKIKYKSGEYKPEQIWSAIKLFRSLRSKKIKFGKNTFSYLITDYMQKNLHQFDMHFGGTLGSNIGIA